MTTFESTDLQTTDLLTRRSLLRGLGRGLAIAMAAGVALPSTRVFAQDDEDENGGIGPDIDHRDDERDEDERDNDKRNGKDPKDGVELMKAWAEGDVRMRPNPEDWTLFVPERGVAFSHPEDWEVTAISDPDINDLYDGNPLGAWVASPEETAGVLLLNVTYNGSVDPIDVAWEQLKSVAPSDKTKELLEDELQPQAGVERAIVAAEVGDYTAVSFVQTMPDALGGAFVYANVVIALTEDFDKTADKVFITILQSQIIGQ